jgi:hypothetical protein
METTSVVDIGAVVAPSDGSSLRPGASDIDVDLIFWADEAEVFVSAGASFELWYGGIVGSGEIREVTRDRS